MNSGSSAKSAAYGALDLITLRRDLPKTYNGHSIRFPPRWSRYYPRSYEIGKTTFLESRCRPGDTVIDGGAHIGLFTVLMARSVGESGRVHAFEPTPDTRRVLMRTLDLNHIANVTVHPEALSASGGSASFYATSDPGSNANSLGHVRHAVRELSVETASIDDLHLAFVSCIKLDIEGGEMDALLGAERVLTRDRPAIAMEVHPQQLPLLGHSSQALWNLLREHRAVVRLDGTALTELEFLRRTEPFEVQVTLDEPA